MNQNGRSSLANKDFECNILRVKTALDAALHNDFKTTKVMAALADLVKLVNLYLENNNYVVTLLVRLVAVFVTCMFFIFGLIPEDVRNNGGWLIGGKANNGLTKEETLVLILKVLLDF